MFVVMHAMAGSVRKHAVLWRIKRCSICLQWSFHAFKKALSYLVFGKVETQYLLNKNHALINYIQAWSATLDTCASSINACQAIELLQILHLIAFFIECAASICNRLQKKCAAGDRLQY